MELEFRYRNNDMGAYIPTFQERVNTMLPAPRSEHREMNAAPALDSAVENLSVTPRMPNLDEVRQTMAQVEEEALQQSQELMQLHSGLNEQRVARLLGLLD
ncbi:MAG: pseudouridine synthase [Desulfovibrionaceae bacterium]|nr:pseudouridine synthase [Desulfovibrionaceae bacterium]